MNIIILMSVGFDNRTPSEHLLSAIIESLFKRGHSVYVIQKDTGGNLPHIPDSIAHMLAGCECVRCFPAAKDDFVARYLAELTYAKKCRAAIKKYKNCDAVFMQSSNIAGIMVKTIRDILPEVPILLNIQDIFPENLMYTGKINRTVYEFMSAEQRYGYKHADRIITISEDMLEQLVEKGVPREKIGLVYNWSYQNEPFDQRAVSKSEIGAILSNKKFNVVYAGNIGVMQNVDLLIKTAKLMTEDRTVHFHIIGDGVYKEKLVQAAEDLPNVSFWPMMPSSMAPSIYCQADVNVIPLAKNIYRTALPSKTATCIAAQKPIVFAIGEKSIFGKMIAEETGCLLIEPDEPKALRDAILQFIDSRKVQNMDEIFRQKFQKSKNSMEYAAVLEELAGKTIEVGQ